jgi:hypothetical protein
MMRRSSPSRLHLALAGTALTGWLAPISFSQTLAQEGGPVVVGQNRPRFDGFVLERINASLELLAKYEKNEHDPTQGPTIKKRESFFREELKLSTDSYVGHENLVDLQADMRLRFEQTSIDDDQIVDEGDQQTYLTLFDVNADILKESRLPWTVYARRDQTRINRTFSGALDATITEFGTSLALRSDFAPSSVSYFHRNQDQTGPGNDSDFSLTQDTFNAESDIIISRQQTLSLDYTFDVIEQSNPTFRDTTDRRHDFNAIHTLEFGPNQRHNLRSSMKYLDRSNISTQRRLRWDELLQLEHTNRLHSRFDTVYEQRSQSGTDQTFARGSGQVRYDLFESLTTTLSGGASRNELEGQLDNESVFADLFLDYTKQVPFGRLDSGVNIGVIDQRNGERGQTVFINNDSRVFNDPLPIIISRRFIEPGSVIVSDIADIRVFAEGADYTVRFLTDRIEIRRVVGGAIADGDTVLIDYAIGPEPGSSVFTTNSAVSVRYSIGEGPLTGLGVYARLSAINQDVDARDPSVLTFEDRTFLEYGLDYRRKGLFLVLERERLWSDFSPFERTRLEARYAYRLGRQTTLAAESTYSVVDFINENNRVELTRLRGTWTQRVRPDLDFRLKLTYRDEKDDISGDSTGFEQQFEVRWRRNRTDIVFNANNSFLESESSDTTFQFFSLSIRRSF